jgi:hypothetical protein
MGPSVLLDRLRVESRLPSCIVESVGNAPGPGPGSEDSSIGSRAGLLESGFALDSSVVVVDSGANVGFDVGSILPSVLALVPRLAVADRGSFADPIPEGFPIPGPPNLPAGRFPVASDSEEVTIPRLEMVEEP